MVPIFPFSRGIHSQGTFYAVLTPNLSQWVSVKTTNCTHAADLLRCDLGKSPAGHVDLLRGKLRRVGEINIRRAEYAARPIRSQARRTNPPALRRMTCRKRIISSAGGAMDPMRTRQ